MTSSSPPKDAFNPGEDPSIAHHKIGVWDLYVQHGLPSKGSPSKRWTWLEDRAEAFNNWKYLWRAIYDLRFACGHLLLAIWLVTALTAVTPSITLWFEGQLLEIANVAIEQRTVDKAALFRIGSGRVICSIVTFLANHAYLVISQQLNGRITRYYSVHNFHALARLDLPTFEDPVVSGQMGGILPGTSMFPSMGPTPWMAISSIMDVGSMILRLSSQSVVLVDVFLHQRDGPLLAGIAILGSTASMVSRIRGGGLAHLPRVGVWAATTRNEDYLRTEGYKQVIAKAEHRKELVAYGLAEYMTDRYREMVQRLGNKAGDFYTMIREQSGRIEFSDLIQNLLQQLPHIVFTLRATQYPTSIPISMASLSLIQRSSSTFVIYMERLYYGTGSLGDQLNALRQLYEADKVENHVMDGEKPYPENTQSLHAGMSIEFINVSFSYPGTEQKVLQGVSFKILPGQLCVIVGTNGSGKSTVLKLCSRIYNPTEGSILIDGHDIRTLKLADLRRAMAVLFQDYTYFPLSVRDNIALGSPKHAHDDARVHEAARLAGAEDIIERQPDRYDEYLNRPVRDYYSDLPEGTKSLFGRTVDHGGIPGMIGSGRPMKSTLSGGQMQRLAVARTFMRSLPTDSEEETTVGLLLFDEPSAALDPKAEHDLFARLRELRGNKTMIFSTHRFGNLTRHASLILYMSDSVIVETGTHDELLKHDGEYARLWKMQAQAFM